VDPHEPLHEQVRQQFALLAPAEGSALAAAIDRACELVAEHERMNDISWNAWIDDQRELEDAQQEIDRLRAQLVGHPNPEEERHAA